MEGVALHPHRDGLDQGGPVAGAGGADGLGDHGVARRRRRCRRPRSRGCRSRRPGRPGHAQRELGRRGAWSRRTGCPRRRTPSAAAGRRRSSRPRATRRWRWRRRRRTPWRRCGSPRSLNAERDAGHHGPRVGQVRHHREDAARPLAHVEVAVAALGRARWPGRGSGGRSVSGVVPRTRWAPRSRCTGAMTSSALEGSAAPAGMASWPRPERKPAAQAALLVGRAEPLLHGAGRATIQR